MQTSKWNILTGDEQIGEQAQTILDAEITSWNPTATAMPESTWVPQLPKDSDFSALKFPVAKVVDAPVIHRLVSVEPVEESDSKVFYLDISKDLEAEITAEYNYYAKDIVNGEVMKRFVYGGVLSQRGGYFVVHKDHPDRVLRYAQIWMS